MELPLKPSLVVDTGGGFHVYWLFHESEIITDWRRSRDDVRTWAAFVQQQIPATDPPSGLGQILRVPGTLNFKDPQDPRPVRVCWHDPSVRYAPCDFEEWFPPAKPKAVPTRYRRQQRGHPGVARLCAELAAAEPGSRNATLNSTGFRAGKLVGVYGLDREDVKHHLHSAAESIGLFDDQEREKSVDTIDRAIEDGVAAVGAPPRKHRT